MVNVNPLFVLVKRSKMPVIRLAEKVGISRNRISQLMAVDALPRNVEVQTLDKIAAGVGYRVIISFEPIGGDNGAK